MKSFINVFFFLLFTHHFACTGLYLMPKNPGSMFYAKYVTTYMRFMFDQNWQLFAPEPAMFNTKMYVSCNSKAKIISWYDTQKTTLDEHYNNRFSFRNKLIHYLAGVPRELANKARDIKTEHCIKHESEQDLQKCVSSHIKSSKEYTEALTLAKHYCRKITKIDKNSIRIKVLISEVVPYSNIFYGNNKMSQIEEVSL